MQAADLLVLPFSYDTGTIGSLTTTPQFQAYFGELREIVKGAVSLLSPASGFKLCASLTSTLLASTGSRVPASCFGPDWPCSRAHFRSYLSEVHCGYRRDHLCSRLSHLLRSAKPRSPHHRQSHRWSWRRPLLEPCQHLHCRDCT